MPLLYPLPSPPLLKLFRNGVEYNDYDADGTGIFMRAMTAKNGTLASSRMPATISVRRANSTTPASPRSIR